MIYVDISYDFSKLFGKEETINSFSVINQMEVFQLLIRKNAFRKANNQVNLEKIVFDMMVCCFGFCQHRKR